MEELKAIIEERDEELAKIKEKLAGCVETLLLADHMGDAHDAGIELIEILMGDEGRKKYYAYVGGDVDAFRGVKMFTILGREEDHVK